MNQAIDRILPHVIQLRHRLHAIPEIGYQEHQTADLIRQELDRLRIPHLPGPPDAATATIALIGDDRKPCIALRADIDALPITERTGAPYASTHPGLMHACGHDGHAAMLLGAAAVLKSVESDLDCCVKLIFQQAEETGRGAERLVSAGVLDGRVGPKVSAIFGIHGWPGLPVGTVSTRPGPLMAACDDFAIVIRGQGGHAAFPHTTRDPIVAAAQTIVQLQSIVSRQLDPTEPLVVSVSQISAGTATNIIPDECHLAGTVRSLSQQVRPWVKEAIEHCVQTTASAGRCQARITWRPSCPATINDPAMADFVAAVARDTLGSDQFIAAARASMGGEDFSYYLEKVPGCFFMIGLCPADCHTYPSLHSDQMDFPDAALATGIRMHVGLAKSFLP